MAFQRHSPEGWPGRHGAYGDDPAAVGKALLSLPRATRTQPRASGHGMTIAVATSPQAADGQGMAAGSLATEVRLCKDALLYGDHVVLYSPNHYMLTGLEELIHLDFAGRLQFLRAVAPAMESGRDGFAIPNLEELVRLQRKRRRTRDEIRLLLAFRSKIDREWPGLIETVQQLRDDAGADALRSAIDRGLLTVHPYMDHDAEFSPDAVMYAMVERIAEILRDSGQYPLFDDRTGHLVRAGIQEGIFAPTGSSRVRGKQIKAAAGFLERLPSLPAASIDEVIDVRQELANPLVNFRSIVTKLAAGIDADATSSGFPREIEDLWYAHAEPALQAIRETIEDNSYLRQLRDRTIQDGHTIGVGGLSLALSQVGDLSALISGGLVAGAAISTAAVRGLIQRHEVLREVSRREFYFLHGVDQGL